MSGKSKNKAKGKEVFSKHRLECFMLDYGNMLLPIIDAIIKKKISNSHRRNCLPLFVKMQKSTSFNALFTMKKLTASLFLLALCIQMQAQANPVITNWLINTTNLKGRHYVAGNSTPINDNVLANVQSVQYSTDWVYVDATGILAYITGPFQDGNPSLATKKHLGNKPR